MAATVDTFEITWCSFKTDDRLLCGLRGTQFVRGQPYPVSRLVAIDVSGKAKPQVLVQNGDRGRFAVPGSHPRLAAQRSQARADRAHRRRRPVPDRARARRVHRPHAHRAAFALADHWTGPRTATAWCASVRATTSKQSYITRDSSDAAGARSPSGTWREPTSTSSALAPSPRTLLVERRSQRPQCHLRAGPRARRAIASCCSRTPRSTSAIRSTGRRTSRIVGFGYDTDRAHRKFFDAEAEVSCTARSIALLPDADNEVVDSSTRRQTLLIASRADVRPTEYYDARSRAPTSCCASAAPTRRWPARRWRR